ncbi:hypothetical protein WI40_15135 [Burkholderia ubonensis]|nr:hypothetical protein WI40_15135 [Burkholderia ubonensis]
MAIAVTPKNLDRMRKFRVLERAQFIGGDEIEPSADRHVECVDRPRAFERDMSLGFRRIDRSRCADTGDHQYECWKRCDQEYRECDDQADLELWTTPDAAA